MEVVDKPEVVADAEPSLIDSDWTTVRVSSPPLIIDGSSHNLENQDLKLEAGFGGVVDTVEHTLRVSSDAVVAELHTRSPSSPRARLYALRTRPRSSLTLEPPVTDSVELLLEQDDLSDLEDDPERAEIERKKLRKLRIRVLRKRADLRVKRVQLRRKEAIKVSADSEFMSFVQEKIAKHLLLAQDPVQRTDDSISRDLEQYFAAMQVARNEYGPLEDDYNQLADALDDLEFDLARAEGRVYKPISPDSRKSLSSVTASSLSTQEGYPPLLVSYFTRVGDLENAKEKYEEMMQEQETLQHTRKTKEMWGREFDPELILFLKQLPEKLTVMEAQIKVIETDIEQLRTQCEEQGIDVDITLDDDAESIRTTSNDIAEDTFLDDLQGTKKPQSGPIHSMFPLLFPKSRADLEKSYEDQKSLQVLITEFDENDKNDRINRWLLHGLRSSPLGVDLLRHVFLKYINDKFGQTDVVDWQRKVLDFWGVDGANEPADVFEPHHASLDTGGSNT